MRSQRGSRISPAHRIEQEAVDHSENVASASRLLVQIDLYRWSLALEASGFQQSTFVFCGYWFGFVEELVDCSGNFVAGCLNHCFTSAWRFAELLISSPLDSTSQALIRDGPKASCSSDQISISAKYPWFLGVAPVPESGVKSNEENAVGF